MRSSLSIPNSDSISPDNSIFFALVLAFALRVFMTFFGSRVLDSSAVNLNYTDIDYNIFTDAAQFVLEGKSPYERSTYRYPPLLALIMTPNILLLPEWGKLLFSAADVGIVYLIYAVRTELDKKRPTVRKFYSHTSDSDSMSSDDNYEVNENDDCKNTDIIFGGMARKESHNVGASAQREVQNVNNKDIRNITSGGCTVAWLWAVNPLAINICTRGSADSITNLLVLALLYFLMQQGSHRGRTALCGLLYGALIHLRIYPVIYLLGILNYLFHNYNCRSCRSKSEDKSNRERRNNDVDNRTNDFNSTEEDEEDGKYEGDERDSNRMEDDDDMSGSDEGEEMSDNILGQNYDNGYNCAPSTSSTNKSYFSRFYRSGINNRVNSSNNDGRSSNNNGIGSKSMCNKRPLKILCGDTWQKWRNSMTFLVYSSLSFLLLSMGSYLYCGGDFLEHAVLYHLKRTDHRHNFSPLFYGIYLHKSAHLPIEGARTAHTACTVMGVSCMDLLMRFGPFLPQLLILLVSSRTLAPINLPAWLLVQTYSFVSFNKVITAQYFTWFAFIILLLTPLPSKTIKIKMQVPLNKLNNEKYVNSILDNKNVKRSFLEENKTNKLAGSSRNYNCNIFSLLILWSISLCVWLYFAYELEFKGIATFLPLWYASIFFHVVNAFIIVLIILYFKEGKQGTRKKGK